MASAADAGQTALTHGGVVGQVWRSPRQVRLARLLRSVEVRSIDASLGRDAGLILAADGSSDVVDAALVALADDHDTIVTSDPEDLRRLAAAAGVRVRILAI